MSAMMQASRSRRLLLFASGTLLGVVVIAAGFLLVSALLEGDDPPEAFAAPRFVEVQGAVDHVYDGEFQYFVGGGVAVLDCDQNGLPDLFFAGGEKPSSLYRNVSPQGGELKFERVDAVATNMTGVTGAYPLDVDSDGLLDLAVLRVGPNSMLRGKGDCSFEYANDVWDVDGGQDWTVAFSATWEAMADLPTLAFGNYLALDQNGERTECADHLLFRPANGSYGAPDRLEPGWCALSFLFSDWARKGGADLRMTNDRHYYRNGEEQLWSFDPAGEPRLYTREEGWRQVQIWGMGIASQDVTGDGLPEVFLTSQGDNKLQTLASGAAQPSYEDIALAAGVNAHRPFQGDTDRPSTAWHAEFDDVNNDGYSDLFVTKGNVEEMAEFAMRDPNNLLLGQKGNDFVEAAGEAGLLDYERSRGAALTDLNLDGMLDVVVVERRAPVRVWRNLGFGNEEAPEQMGHWLAIDLVQPGPNRDAIGAWIEIRYDGRSAAREVTVGGGHAGGEIGWIHFGLGESEVAELRVQWPDGEMGEWMSLPSDRFWVVDRQSGTPVEWMPN